MSWSASAGVNSLTMLRASSDRSTGSAVQLHRAGVEAGQVEQVHRQLLQARHLLAHRLEELAPGVLVELLVLEQLHEAGEREDRRAQLVRGRGDELLARHVHLAQLRLHLVEGAGELAELVLGVDRQRLDEAALRPPRRRPPRGASSRRASACATRNAPTSASASATPVATQHAVAHEVDGLGHVVEVARVEHHRGRLAALAAAKNGCATSASSSPASGPTSAAHVLGARSPRAPARC